MILFYADGRLGNQVFQYAFLRSLAKNGERILCANMKMFFHTFRVLSVNVHHVENRYVLYILRNFVIPYLILPLASLKVIGVVRQKTDAAGSPLPDYSSKKGLLKITFVAPHFFQSETLFDKDLLFSEIQIEQTYRSQAEKFLSGIPNTFSKVFVHVRRGDYAYERFRGVRGIELPEAYFRKAIREVRGRIRNPFFIFVSDDPPHVERCFEDIEPKIISRCSMGVDLAIMTQCVAGIISNSSFSWWGSALMANGDLVIAPKFWYGWRQRVESHPGIQPSIALLIDPNE